MREDQMVEPKSLMFPNIEGKKVPLQLIETIRKKYNDRSKHSPTFEAFMNHTTCLLQRLGNKRKILNK